MGEFGLKIKNIKAGTLFGYNQGVRDYFDSTPAMFSNSLFSDYITNNGMKVWKDTSTRDIICMDFDFGSRSYNEEYDHMIKNIKKIYDEKEKKKTGNPEAEISDDDFSKIMEELKEDTPKKINELKEKYGDSYQEHFKEEIDREYILTSILSSIEDKKDKYVKMSKEEIRTHFYENGVDVRYVIRNKNGKEKEEVISYKMLYRSSAKAKIGQVMFINEKLYKKAYNWLTMGLGNKMPYDNAKIVEMSAYAPLTTSTIVGKMHIPVEDILILKDQDSLFRTMAKVVKSEDYEKEVVVLDEEKTNKNRENAIDNGRFLEDGTPSYRRAFKRITETRKKCIVSDEETDVKNTLWDGMGLIEASVLPNDINGMVLLRNHFFKACAFNTNIQKFFKEWCENTGNNYDTYELEDMFGVKHKIKDIKMITTDNAIKWKKFSELMGNTLQEAYLYWCEKVNDDGSYFGIVKTDHASKLGDVQQMSYQMINTLPCTQKDIDDLAEISVKYVEDMKADNDKFEQFLRKNKNEINHYEMLADLYQHNKDFSDSTWFRYEKKEVIKRYVNRLRSGKITIQGDNLTVCGNPYGLLLYSVGEEWKDDPTLNYEKGVIQCYAKKFEDGEFLCGIRNPHNSPNNICYFHNRYSEEMNRYFNFSDNIIAVNCIMTDVQDRANGMDFDSDFQFVTNNRIMVKCAKKAYEEYPTIVNRLKESGITYNNSMSEYAAMDNKFAKSRTGIGESSNLAQLAMTYYWTDPAKELYDNFVILSVLAQVIIDGCKREYEVDGVEEIKRIRKLQCMLRNETYIDKNGKKKKIPKDFPLFMKYTKEIKYTENGIEVPYDEVMEKKTKIKNRIDYSLVCPMNWLQRTLNEIKQISNTYTIPTEHFFVKMEGKANNKAMRKINDFIRQYDRFVKDVLKNGEPNENEIEEIKEKSNDVITKIQKMNIKNIVTFNRLIETALKIEKNNNKKITNINTQKNTRKILNILYRCDKEKFLKNFKKM